MRSLEPKATWREVATFAIASLFGAVSFFYPYGRDQALFHYVGKEWFTRGALPYRDLVEHKPPGIFIVFGAIARVFGTAQWPIRVLDMVMLYACAGAASLLVLPRDEKPSVRTLAGVGAIASVLYYGQLNFWDTAQCDFTYVAIATVALAVLHRSRRLGRGQWVAGLLFGFALLVKPLAGAFGIIALVLTLRRAKIEGGTREIVRSVFRFGVATMLLPVLMVAYFAANGALGDLVLWVGKVNGHYARNETGFRHASDFIVALRYPLLTFGPLAAILIGTAGLRRLGRREEPDRYEWRLFLALFAAGMLAVIGQMKFFRYHFTAILPSLFVAATLLVRDLEGRLGARTAPTVLAVTLAVFLGSEPAAHGDNWWRSSIAVARYYGGGIGRHELEHVFNVPVLGYDYADVAATGRWLGEHTTKDDIVVARGFEPGIYLVANRRYSGRFFWSNFITDMRRSLKHDEWLAEETAHFETARPKYAVAIFETGLIDGADWFAGFGYVEVARFGGYRIMARP